MSRAIASGGSILGKLKVAALVLAAGAVWADPKSDYAEYCAECHGAERIGAMGPALTPTTLKRMRGASLTDVIRDGRPATQMPGFGEFLDPAAIDALAAFLKTEPDHIPNWGAAEIAASRTVDEGYVAAAAPVWDADPMNITIVVETGDHHVSVLDGDTFAVLDRFETPFAVHGGPKYSPEGRYLFVMSRDGWVQKYDIWSLKQVGRVRAGLNSRNIAMSGDGKWLAVANYLPNTLTILSTDDLSVAKVIEVEGKGSVPSRVSAVYQAPPRESFVLALKDVPEIWEVFYGPNPPHYGFAHDWRIEGPAKNDDPFPVRKITTKDFIDDFFFDQSYEYLIGASRDGKSGQVVDLVIGHKIADLPLAGMPHLSSGITWKRGNTTIMATPHITEGLVTVIDMATWQPIKEIKTDGPGFFMRSHENSPYVWVDVFFGENKDVMHVIDKQSLEIVKTLRPAPGKTVAHVEFTKDGKFALVSIWEDDGAVIVYDALTFEEVRRLPMRKPSGKYNVWNKITFSEGTSH